MQSRHASLIYQRFVASLAYALMLLVAVLAFLIIARWGGTLAAPEAAAANAAHDADAGHATAHVLLALVAVVALGRLFGKVLVYVHQPPVIGEVLAGIVLGPSLLGRVAPAASRFILPAEMAPYLEVLAQLGVVLYMFLVGLELNGGLLRGRASTTIAISHASIVAPFLAGAVLALWLYPRLSTSNVPFTSFALFLGVAMSVTAFPVLARILSDRQMTRTELGVMALSCAASDDVTAWCLLAVVVGVAQSHLAGALTVVASSLAYLVLVFLVLRPLIAHWLVRHDGPLTPGKTAVVFTAVLLSALTTEWIGIHAVFGAFVIGAVIPHDSQLAQQLTHKLEDSVTVLLLPAFFALTGMRTELGLVQGGEAWLMCGLVTVVATLGKFGGTLGAARLTGLSWQRSAALGVLMNTRGLMELVVLNIGLDLGVISPALFAMMVLMAVITTMMTTPLLQLLAPAGR
jgi:Kef-type K+ transport system membrane component KefB